MKNTIYFLHLPVGIISSLSDILTNFRFVVHVVDPRDLHGNRPM